MVLKVVFTICCCLGHGHGQTNYVAWIESSILFKKYRIFVSSQLRF